MVIQHPNGRWVAHLDRSEESAGCHGVGGYNTTTTVVRILDGGRVVHEVTRTRTISSWESSGDDEKGATIDAMRFDGNALILVLSAGDDLVVPLPPT